MPGVTTSFVPAGSLACRLVRATGAPRERLHRVLLIAMKESSVGCTPDWARIGRFSLRLTSSVMVSELGFVDEWLSGHCHTLRDENSHPAVVARTDPQSPTINGRYHRACHMARTHSVGSARSTRHHGVLVPGSLCAALPPKRPLRCHRP